MTHIVFQQSDIDTLKKAMDLDDSLSGDIIEIQDELAVGPIADIVDDRKKMDAIKEKLSNEDEQVWIWVAPNQHDVCGYYWLISQLKDHEKKVYVLSLNNLPFISEKGNIFYPVNLFEIPPKEFKKAKKLARPVTASEFESDADE